MFARAMAGGGKDTSLQRGGYAGGGNVQNSLPQMGLGAREKGGGRNQGGVLEVGWGKDQGVTLCGLHGQGKTGTGHQVGSAGFPTEASREG